MDLDIVMYWLIFLCLMLLGFAIHKYLKWAKVNNLKVILGINVYWLKFVANFLIVISILTILASIVALLL